MTKKILIDEATIQRALEALEAKGDAWVILERKARAALREALAQPTQTATYTCGVCGVSMQMETQPAQEPYCYHDGRNIVGKEFKNHSDVFPLFTAPQPKAEPQKLVAWADLNALTEQFNSVNCGTAYRLPGEGRQPLYAAPPLPQRKPLTDEEIYSVLENLQVMYNRPPTTDSRIIFARAIEAAHGIKGVA